MKRLLASLGLASLLVAAAASAAYVDGMALRRYCDRTDPFHSRCTAYVSGVVDATGHDRCIPDGTDIQVVAKAVRDHLDEVENPALHSAADLVKEALDASFACE